jgi:hypothetical protein
MKTRMKLERIGLNTRLYRINGTAILQACVSGNGLGVDSRGLITAAVALRTRISASRWVEAVMPRLDDAVRHDFWMRFGHGEDALAATSLAFTIPAQAAPLAEANSA